MNKLKFKSNSQILKLNNKIYIPFLIHNLPNYFHKINPINIIKINTIIYINKSEIKNSKTIIDLLNSSNINSNNNIK